MVETNKKISNIRLVRIYDANPEFVQGFFGFDIDGFSYHLCAYKTKKTNWVAKFIEHKTELYQKKVCIFCKNNLSSCLSLKNQKEIILNEILNHPNIRLRMLKYKF